MQLQFTLARVIEVCISIHTYQNHVLQQENQDVSNDSDDTIRVLMVDLHPGQWVSNALP